MEDNHLEYIRNQYQENFGTPSLALRFNSDANPVPEAFREPMPEYLDIYIWYPDDKSDLTTIATCGMSSVAFKDVDYRGELLLALELKPSKETEKQLVEFIANLCVFPFQQKQTYKWWFSMSLTGNVPGFEPCNAIVLHPPFTENGWAVINTDLFDVQLFNVVPLTEHEHKIKIEQGVGSLQNYLGDRKVNVFAPR